MNQVAEQLEGGPVVQQVEVLIGFVEAVRAFGDLDREVVDPSLFSAMSAQVLEGLATSSGAAGIAVASTLEDLPFMKQMDEPEGLGWFACGAVVELIYASWYLQGRARSIEYAYSRMADLLDAVDDELAPIVHENADEAAERLL